MKGIERNPMNIVNDIIRNTRKNYMKRIKKEIKSGEKIIERNEMSRKYNID